jgi:GT2 family glycosyltransferase
MEELTLSIVVGTYNRIELLRQCLEALIGKVQTKHEIIVVDAGSTDGTLEYLMKLQGVRLISDGQLVGQAKSLNRVIMGLRSKYVCWLSDDNVVLDEMLDLSVDILEKHADIGMVGLKVKDLTGPYTTSMPYLGRVWSSGILNCNQGMLSTRLFREIDGFDEDYRDYGIDIDLTTKVLLAGYKVVLTKHVVIHHYRNHEQQSWINKDERSKRISAAREIYARKYESLFRYGHKYGKKIEALFDEKAKMGIYKKWRWKIKKFYSYVGRFGIHLGTLPVLGEERMAKIIHNLLFSSFLDAKRLNHDHRDLYNIIHGKFISMFDLITNYRNPFYLVQKIPDKVLVSSAESTSVKNNKVMNIEDGI